MSWASDLIHGRNGNISLTKVAGWLFTVDQAVTAAFPGALTASWQHIVTGVIGILGALGVKNAIDKSAPPGSAANPTPPPAT